ncbi:putative glutamate receptor [Caerostris extrusa]|uniref:Glutamate receptor n=1 Tax=Caerostris extrusa TaxID=172846 RepID=A0AAV4PHU2_CAEEX|nr:putative glutamate receptor [Caerostris extrusa]
MKFPAEIQIGAVPLKNLLEIIRDENGNTQLGGNIGRLIHLVTSELKFKYKIKIPLDNEFGTRGPGGNWTGLLGMLQRKEADMVFSIAVTEERTEVADFSQPYAFDAATFW